MAPAAEACVVTADRECCLPAEDLGLWPQRKSRTT